MTKASRHSTLGFLLHERRVALNMTMRDVAGQALSPTAVNNIEKGKIKPSIDTVFYLCQALQLQPEHILLYYPDFNKSCPVLLEIVDAWIEAGRIEESITLLYDLYWVATERAEQEELLAEIQTRIGLAFGQAGRYENARQVMRDTYNYYHQTNNIRKQILILNYIGRFLLEERQWNIAIASYKQAIELSERFRFLDSLVGHSFLGVANAFLKTGEMREAMYYSQRSSRTFQDLNDLDGAALSLLQQASIWAAEGQTTKAFQLSCHAYRYFAKTNNGKRTASALITLGDVLHWRRKFALAKECYRQAAEWTKQYAPLDLYQLNLEQARLELSAGDPVAAKRFAEAALAQAKHPRIQSQVYQLLAKCNRLASHLTGYVAYMNLAIEAMKKSGDSYAAALLQCELADVTNDLECMRAATRILREQYDKYSIL